ncbi:hypothetical protein C7441_11093 [Pseudaminobacter salicylatoxidans]|uniref:Uncharacterized protein n=2 Tax=Pseudaminobacter salicylatoxidans TaxID=93369 RepID=A0A316C0Q7_PSESE|nr:hypothetical protein C7441_11093 [Pseudaminobacter salicylatoxidans]
MTLDNEDAMKATFLKNITNHQMTVHHADGVFRHLSFRQSGSFTYHFNITTWPGYLCISGDMGSFVFARLRDMFEFFRGERINSGYWAEKLTAHDRHGGHRTFSHDLYKAALEHDFAQWTFGSDEDRARSWEAIADEWTGILGASTTNEAVRQALDWKCHISDQEFVDFWDHELEEYSYQFIWSCHAIQWAIARFDELPTKIVENMA